VRGLGKKRVGVLTVLYHGRITPLGRAYTTIAVVTPSTYARLPSVVSLTVPLPLAALAALVLASLP